MHFAAFNGLGWQRKLANSFYTGARAERGTMPPRVEWLVGAVAVVLPVMGVLLGDHRRDHYTGVGAPRKQSYAM